MSCIVLVFRHHKLTARKQERQGERRLSEPLGPQQKLTNPQSSDAGQEQPRLPGCGSMTPDISHSSEPWLGDKSRLNTQMPKSIDYFFCFQAQPSSLLFSHELKLTQTETSSQPLDPMNTAHLQGSRKLFSITRAVRTKVHTGALVYTQGPSFYLTTHKRGREGKEWLACLLHLCQFLAMSLPRTVESNSWPPRVQQGNTYTNTCWREDSLKENTALAENR